MAKDITISKAARKGIKSGIDKVASAVKTTMGPRGRNVVLDRGFGGPNITKDGVTVAKDIELEDKVENIGAELIKEIASKTDESAGDGTTTSVVLGAAILDKGISVVDDGANAVQLKHGIDAAAELVIAELEGMSKKIKPTDDMLAKVAAISANDEAIGEKIAEVFKEVKAEGVVTVEESQALGITHRVVEGMQFDRGYVSPYMMTDPQRMEAVWEKPAILITDQKISSLNDILPLLEKLAQTGRKDLVIIAEDIDGEALATLVVNKLRGTFNALAIKAPGYGDRRKEMLQDIAIVTGGQLISEEVGLKLEQADMAMLGSADRVVASKDNTTIVGGKGAKAEIKNRAEQLRGQAEGTKSDYDKEKLMERVAKLTGGVAVIEVGAPTETEMKEAKYRVEDAVNATRAALEEGIVPGGGVAILNARAKVLKSDAYKKADGDHKAGMDIFLNALELPLMTIAENAGKNGQEILDKVLELDAGHGWNALTERTGDMFKEGVIDPLKVVKAEVLNASSLVGLVLMTEAVVTDIPKEDDDSGAGAGMPGGMGMGM
jgi:chaperonin GroEL